MSEDDFLKLCSTDNLAHSLSVLSLWAPESPVPDLALATSELLYYH